MLLLSLLACEPEPEPGLTVRSTIELVAAASGGWDDWDGAALTWVVDTDAGWTFVAGHAYELGVSRVDFAPGSDPVENAEDWEVDVSPAMEDAVATWPMLGLLVADGPGIRGMSEDFAAVLAEGDPTSSTPESLWVAVDGEGRLSRGNDDDEFEADLVFVEVTKLGAGAEAVDPLWGLAVEDTYVEFASGGSD